MGELHDQLQARGVSLSNFLFDAIRRMAEGDGVHKTQVAHTLLILHVPIVREIGAQPEKIQVQGFVVHTGLGELGIKGGALISHNGKYWQDTPLRSDMQPPQDWRALALEPLEILRPFTRECGRTVGGIKSEGPIGTLAGVGALGSTMANLWHREGWGAWTVIDPDHVKPHNLARNTAFEFQVGNYKVDVVKSLERNIFPGGNPVGKAITESACNFANQEVMEALNSSELVVDATTTLEFPRDLSTCDSVKRAVSIFLTPSGLGSVMLFEDAKRSRHLDSLEAQYYRAVINRDWGKDHLLGNQGHFWVGAGCRDVSAVIPNDLIQLHAATLARQVRLRSEQAGASIQVWHSDPVSGAVRTDVVLVAKPLVCDFGNMKLQWDEGLRAKVQRLRADRLPNETGGVLLGYFDLKLGNVYVVDVLPPPLDSQGDRGSFTRGTTGLPEAVKNVQERTGGVVSYIGEWHSHPPKVSVNPSAADIYQLAYLARALHADGLPAVQLIVGDLQEQWVVGEVQSVTN